MSLDQDIRSHLRNYLRGEATFREFEDWFVDATWDARNASGDFATLSLIYGVERVVSEFTSGHRTEKQLRRFLEPLSDDSDKLVFSSSSAITRSPTFVAHTRLLTGSV